MTTLLIDAGNSRLKWGIYRQGLYEPGTALSYQKGPLEQQLKEAWLELIEVNQKPARIVLANVAGARVTDALESWREDIQNSIAMTKDEMVKDESWLTIVNITALANAYGVKNAYSEPAKLGADRWAGLVAARHYIDGDVCIIDCGTALTVDVLAANGEHKGGVIMPGWEMMKKSLIMNTEGISQAIHEESRELTPLLGSNTGEAIEAGCYAACAGAIEHIIRQHQHETGAELQCVLTGGAAPRLLPLLGALDILGKVRHEPDWVLKGLMVISDSINETDQLKDSGLIT